ncbi:MAG: hypothetical protein QOI26_966, partial [Pseudonocardiales bacterium]|nr:hypothetical protein [Pseudonocardiales bacterium]
SGPPSKLTLLRPKWLLLHVLTFAVCAAMIWLGHWQWGAAIRHHGDLRNYGYALQWWAFVGFTLLMWFRVVTDHLRAAEAAQADGVQHTGAQHTGAQAASVRDAGTRRPPAAAPATRYLGYTAPPPSPELETDPERRRLNAYLAQLSAADRKAAE